MRPGGKDDGVEHGSRRHVVVAAHLAREAAEQPEAEERAAFDRAMAQREGEPAPRQPDGSSACSAPTAQG